MSKKPKRRLASKTYPATASMRVKKSGESSFVEFDPAFQYPNLRFERFNPR